MLVSCVSWIKSMTEQAVFEGEEQMTRRMRASLSPDSIVKTSVSISLMSVKKINNKQNVCKKYIFLHPPRFFSRTLINPLLVTTTANSS